MFPWASRAVTSTPYCGGNRAALAVQAQRRARGAAGDPGDGCGGRGAHAPRVGGAARPRTGHVEGKLVLCARGVCYVHLDLPIVNTKDTVTFVTSGAIHRPCGSYRANAEAQGKRTCDPVTHGSLGS